MEVYLVGGAVRDKLLNLPTKEHDWVVVGATPQEMQALGYKSVGRDFPVFLHPKTQDEYALARKERKIGRGYHGFECISDPTISLQEDLLRRDLTINAIAMDQLGNIIDPYNGQADINNKILRHVSPAFIEDPVRVLRVARFYARFKHLGFKVAPETIELMHEITRSGELRHLVPERVWQEWQSSLLTLDPDGFIEVLHKCDALKLLFPAIYHSFDANTLKIIKAARIMSDIPEFIFSMTMRNLDVLQQIVEQWKIPNSYRKLATAIMRWHKHIHLLNSLSDEEIYEFFRLVDAIRSPEETFQYIIQAAAVEHYVATGHKTYSVLISWHNLIKACQRVKVADIIKLGLKGSAIQQALKQAYLECIHDCSKK